MTFDLRNLRAFLAVVDHGSTGRAAEACALSQSALSRSIQRLEGRLGAALFDRDTTGMVLTTLGRALEPRARLLVAEGESTLEELRSLRGLSRGTVRVGAVTSVTKGLLPAALDQMLLQYPGLRMEVVESVDDVLKDALIKSEIDLAITTTPADDDEMETVLRSGWRTTMHMVASTSHALASRAEVALQELMNERWIMPPPPSLPRQLFEKVFIDAGCEVPPMTAESRSHVVTLALVANGGFLSLMSKPQYRAELASGVLMELRTPPVQAELEFHALARRNRTMPAPAKALLTTLTAMRF